MSARPKTPLVIKVQVPIINQSLPHLYGDFACSGDEDFGIAPKTKYCSKTSDYLMIAV